MGKNKNILLIFLFLIIFLFIFLVNNNKSNKKEISLNNTSDNSKITTLAINKEFIGEVKKTLFVPYWSLESGSLTNNYDRVIYFGIEGIEKGINLNEQGYQGLSEFNQLNFSSNERYLIIRMINTDENLKILKNQSSMIRIIEQSVDIAKENNFDGIVLDLEVGVLFGDNVKDEISSFSNKFYEISKLSDLKYVIAIYGDVFYRKRPYDISQLSKNSDEIMIMAYDFHKSIGEPGPNFPLTGQEKYGYDMKKLMDDFLKYSKPEKLSVIFGMYGYDWTVDDQDRPIKQANALSLNEIRSKHSNDCNSERCEFVDSEGRRHIIWFENEESVKKKIGYLKSRGIGSFAYWANGYF
ncbi:MAG: glycosyl hydrolase family 18 protein [bacterium]